MTAPVSALARKWRLDIDTSPAKDGSSWVQVKGIQSLTPKIDPNMEDDSDYDSGGWGSDAKTGQKWSVEAKIIRKYTGSNVYDAGQEALRAAGEAFGTANQVHIRWYDRNDGPEAYEGSAAVSWSPDGGSGTDLEIVTVTMAGQGTRTLLSPNPA